MSGPGSTPSIWDSLMKASTDDDVRKDWAALCGAWDKFHDSMEKLLAGTKTTPSLFKAVANQPFPPSTPPSQIAQQRPPSAPPANTPPANTRPSDAELAQREQKVLAMIGQIAQTMTTQITAVAHMQGRIAPEMVNAQMSAEYNSGLGMLEKLRPEAKALDQAGKPNALRTLDLHTDDTKKAIEIVRGTIQQTQAFNANISGIWADANRSITQTLQDMNARQTQVYADTNKNWSDTFNDNG